MRYYPVFPSSPIVLFWDETHTEFTRGKHFNSYRCEISFRVWQELVLKCLSGQMFYNAGVLSDAWVEIIAGSGRHAWKISHEKWSEKSWIWQPFCHKNERQRRLRRAFNERTRAFFYVIVVRDRRATLPWPFDLSLPWRRRTLEYVR